jgi:hypothetical protein
MRKLYVALAVAIFTFTVGFSSKAISETTTAPQEDRYDPIRLGMPETIGGYPVLAVLTEDNFVCMRPGEKRFVLQSPQPTIEDGPRDFPKEYIEQELQELNLAEWEWEIVGPGVTRPQLVDELEKSVFTFKAQGCPTLELPIISPVPAGGEREISPSAGFAIIQNLDADKPVVINGQSVFNNGQSVYLVAPEVGNNQMKWPDGYVASCPIDRCIDRFPS